MRRLKRKGYLLFFLSLLLLSTLCGCGGNTASSAASKEKTDSGEGITTEAAEDKDTINLYYLNAEEDGFKKVPYTLQNPNDSVKASYEVLYKLSDTEGNNTSEYKASIFDGIAVNDVSPLENGKENIDFGAAYGQLSHVKEVLLRTSVVKSLLQIKGVEGITFSVNGSSLLDTGKVPVGLMNEDTLLTDDGEKSIYSEKKKVKLYYTNKTGDKLISCFREVEVKNNVPLETQVLLMLKNPPASKKNLKSPLSQDFHVNQTQIMNNTCYVDLSSDIENAVADVKEKITVYAMVNTLTDLDTAYQVQFTIDGKRVSKLNEFEKFDTLLTSNFSLCK